jgi:hypothetical protein
MCACACWAVSDAVFEPYHAAVGLYQPMPAVVPMGGLRGCVKPLSSRVQFAGCSGCASYSLLQACVLLC